MGRFLNGLRPSPAQETKQEPLEIEHHLRVTVFHEGKNEHEVLNNATVRLIVDSGYGEFIGKRINDFGYYEITVPKEVPKPYGSYLVVDAPGYISAEMRYLITFSSDQDLTGGVKLEKVEAPVPQRPTNPEVEIPNNPAGRIFVSGRFFQKEDGKPWVMKALSAFTLFHRYELGQEDYVKAYFGWMLRNGFNTARVLGPLDWPEYTLYRKIENWDNLQSFFNLAEAYGIYILWVPITTKQNKEDHEDLVLHSLDIAGGVDNVLVQICNEPLKDGKCDPVALVSKLGKGRNCLVDYGLYWVDDWDSDWPIADFGSVHLTREYPKFSRKGKDLLELSLEFGVPFVSDEPIGVGEVDIPGRRTTDIDAVMCDAAVSLMLGSGWCYHHELGLHSNIPEWDTIQDDCASELKRVFDFLPEDVNRGFYTAPHLGGFPFHWEEKDSEVGHAYGMIRNGEAYVINILPTVHWKAKPKPGWKIESKLDKFLYKLVRE